MKYILAAHWLAKLGTAKSEIYFDMNVAVNFEMFLEIFVEIFLKYILAAQWVARRAQPKVIERSIILDLPSNQGSPHCLIIRKIS